MLMLTPAAQTVLGSQLRRQGHDFPQSVADQGRFRGMVDVRLHHERIATHRRDRLRLWSVPRPYDQVMDLLQGLGPKFKQIVLNPPPVKIYFRGFPSANTHDLLQAP